MKTLIVIIAMDFIVGFGAVNYVSTGINQLVVSNRGQQTQSTDLDNYLQPVQARYEDEDTPQLHILPTYDPEVTLNGIFDQGSTPHLQGF